MPKYDVTRVNVKVSKSTSTSVKSGGGRRPKCTFDCAFCKGTGVDPDSGILVSKPCRVCKGDGTITMSVSCNSLVEHAYCGGSGRDPNSGILVTKIDSECKGYGKVVKG